MKRLLYFLKSTKWVSRGLFLLWIVFSAFAKFPNESRMQIVLEFGAVFLIPALLVEIFKNPALKKQQDIARAEPSVGLGEKIKKLLFPFRWVYVFLIAFWFYASFFSPYSKTDGIPAALLIYSILSFPPIILIEICARAKKKDPLPKPATTNTDKYMSPRRIAGICLLSLSAIFMVIGIYANSNPETHADNNMLPGFCFFVIGLFFLLISINDPKTKTELAERNEAKRKQKEQEDWAREHAGIYLSVKQIRLLESKIQLPIVETPVFLSQGEYAVYYCAATRQETKTRVVGHTGGYTGASIRIAKGLSIRTGGSSSTPVYGDVSTHYDGELVVTNKRLIFLSEQKGFEVAYNKITAVTTYSDGFSIQSGTHTYVLLLTKPDLAITAFDSVRTGEIPVAGTTEDALEEYSGTDYISADCDIEQEESLTKTIDRYIEKCIKCGKKDEAIEVYRENYPCSLDEAKEVIQQVEWHLLAIGATRNTEEEPIVGTIGKQSRNFSFDRMNGHEFEHFCADLLRKNDFSNVCVTPGSGDQGVDILAEKHSIKYAIQCKNYATPLGNTPVQEVAAGKIFYNCHVGVVLTNSTFTPGAISLAEATGVLLWDRNVLADLMRNK